MIPQQACPCLKQVHLFSLFNRQDVVINPQLFVSILYMPSDRVGGEAEPLGNFFLGAAFIQQSQNFSFPGRSGVEFVPVH